MPARKTARKPRSRAEEMKVLAPDPKVCHDELIDLIAKTFSHRGYFYFRDHCLHGYMDEGRFYSYPASRIGMLDGRIVAHWGVWDYQMRIGSGRVRVAGIGVVATHGDYRKQGLMDKLVRTWLSELDGGDEFDMTVLFGIPDFYHHFGYVRAWPNESWTVNVSRLPQEKPGVRLHEMPTRHDPQAVRLYNRQNATMTGTAVRPTYHVRSDKGLEIFGWNGKDGRLAGYVAVSIGEPKLQVLEHVGDDETALRVIREIAQKHGKTQVEFPWQNAGSSLARRLYQGDVQITTNCQGSGGAMIRTLNLASCLRKIGPELARRLAGSHLAKWRGQLLITDPREKVALQIAPGKVTSAPAAKTACPHAIRGGDEIAQLLIGTIPPEQTIAACSTRVSGEAKQLLPILFPVQYPSLSQWDHY